MPLHSSGGGGVEGGGGTDEMHLRTGFGCLCRGRSPCAQAVGVEWRSPMCTGHNWGHATLRSRG